MFILTIGDIAGLIILAGILIYIIYVFKAGRAATRYSEEANRVKREEPKPAKRPLPIWLAVLEFLLFIGAIYIYCLLRGLIK